MNPIVANTGVPMLFVQMPLLVLALPVIIVIEALLCRRWLTDSWEQAFWGSIVANLVSTVLGFPLLWFALVLVQLLVGGGSMPNLPEPWFSVYTVTIQAAWLLPFEDRFYWMIPTAGIVLLVPAFFVTVIVEGRFYRTMFRESATADGIKAATWKMHLVSYGLLFLAGFVLLGAAVSDHTSNEDVNANRSPEMQAVK